ncbi:hypothetical protein TNCV_71031 [Trichonephila clavipes]|nr:hypothetical protein TNCV_71031 [Trichonephila clavipes]
MTPELGTSFSKLLNNSNTRTLGLSTDLTCILVVKIYRFWNSGAGGAGGARRLRRMQTKEGGSPPPDLNREDGKIVWGLQATQDFYNEILRFILLFVIIMLFLIYIITLRFWFGWKEFAIFGHKEPKRIVNRKRDEPVTMLVWPRSPSDQGLVLRGPSPIAVVLLYSIPNWFEESNSTLTYPSRHYGYTVGGQVENTENTFTVSLAIPSFRTRKKNERSRNILTEICFSQRSNPDEHGRAGQIVGRFTD